MSDLQKAWECLTDVIFNNAKDIPIELIPEFKKLAYKNNVENYCDFQRNVKLSSISEKEPWEWEFLDKLSKSMPENAGILIIKGAAARDMDLYPLCQLRKSTDLDIFVHGSKNYGDQKEFIEHLLKEKICEVSNDWKLYLKKLSNLPVKYENNYVDIHFKLFSPLGNINNCSYHGGKTKQLEKEIIQRSSSYRNLNNIRKMSYEDFWLYNIFNFLKEFPLSNLNLIIDCFLLLKSNKTSITKLSEHAKTTRQVFLYDTGLFIINQFCGEESKTKAGWLNKYIFNIGRMPYADKYSVKSRLIDSYSKAAIVTNGNVILSIILCSYFFIGNNLISSTINENRFSFLSVTNFITKMAYSVRKARNFLKSLCLKLAKTQDSISNTNIIPSTKKLISVKLSNKTFTFNIPTEFYYDLNKVWNGFVTNEHLSKKIEVEKTQNEEISSMYKVVLSKDTVYMNLLNLAHGKADLNGFGNLSANNFWGVRSFALLLFRAYALLTDDTLLVHAGGIKVKDEAFIFPGGTGAGKTTFYNLMLRDNASGINDDTILLKKEGDYWYAHPTPFMSNKQEPLTCKKSKLTGIIDPVKVTGGHEIKPLDLDHGLALILNNTISDFILDENNFILSKTSEKLLDISKQITYSSQIKYSLDEINSLYELINKSIQKPKDYFKFGNKIIRLIELCGNSMEPTFKNGNILCVEEIYPEKLKLNDIICFITESTHFPTVHRIKYLIRHKDSTTAITKGDNSLYEDPPNIFKSNLKVLKVLKRLNASELTKT